MHRYRVLLSAVTIAVLALPGGAPCMAQVTLTEGTNLSVDASSDGRLAIDLLGGIWVLPAGGGTATVVTNGLVPASRPRWSPDNATILYQARTAERNEIRLVDVGSGDDTRLGDGHRSDQEADWHPDGRRIVFASQRHGSGLDLWEMDIPTQLAWRISFLDGDESEPAWSADGRNLIYIHEHDGRWSLMLRRFGQPDRAIVQSEQRLSAPSWRPDGSLVTFLRHGDDGLVVDMVILAEPELERELIRDEDLFVAPVTWLDRQQMLYAANGVIRKRAFDSWTSSTVPFRATIRDPDGAGSVASKPRQLSEIDVPDGRLVLRAARVFDGVRSEYLLRHDIVIAAGRIVSVEPRSEHADAIIVDMGDLTVVPGFIDSYASFPAAADESLGPLLLSLGLTTLVAEHDDDGTLTQRWSGKELPGPRLLPARPIDAPGEDPWLVTIGGDMNAGLEHRDDVARWQSRGVPVLASNWQVGLGSGATLLLGGSSLPASPGGHRYEDLEVTSAAASVTLLSGLADAVTPGIEEVLASRQARLLGATSMPPRRFATPPRLAAQSSDVVLGSRPNGLAPGLGLHAELRALTAAGLKPVQALRAAGVNAAQALGLGLQAGRIATGSVADLVVVDGDPLADIADTLNVVAVVRNGRFFSVIGLIERHPATANVE